MGKQLNDVRQLHNNMLPSTVIALSGSEKNKSVWLIAHLTIRHIHLIRVSSRFAGIHCYCRGVARIFMGGFRIYSRALAQYRDHAHFVAMRSNKRLSFLSKAAVASFCVRSLSTFVGCRIGVYTLFSIQFRQVN